ncbi:hypothetical protein P8605_10655 [Streptomyces sp. T-3]|nr:hypothetical protein [Streptomyces sp. T-3]
MSKRTLLAEAIGHTNLPVPEVHRTLVAKFSDGYLTVDRTDTLVSAKGGWWALREYHLAPEGPGTRVTLRVFNVADRARWAVPLVNKFFMGFPQAMQGELDEMLRSLAAPERHDH